MTQWNELRVALGRAVLSLAWARRSTIRALVAGWRRDRPRDADRRGARLCRAHGTRRALSRRVRETSWGGPSSPAAHRHRREDAICDCGRLRRSWRPLACTPVPRPAGGGLRRPHSRGVRFRDRRVQDSRQTRHRQCVRIASTAADADVTEGVAMPDGADSPAPATTTSRWFTGGRARALDRTRALLRAPRAATGRRGPRRRRVRDRLAPTRRRAARGRAALALPHRGFTLANHRRKHVDLPVDEVPETGDGARRATTPS